MKIGPSDFALSNKSQLESNRLLYYYLRTAGVDASHIKGANPYATSADIWTTDGYVGIRPAITVYLDMIDE